MSFWFEDAFFYHLFPLGALGAPWNNPGGEPVSRIRQLKEWIEPAARIGANALLLGPLWESGTHGYDTHDYTALDRRLGTEEDLKEALTAWKARGFRLVFDGVFNHCGRGFGPFEDLRRHGRSSRFAPWFAGVNFEKTNAYGDPFSYEGWDGHLNLVKFNLKNPEVRAHLLGAVGLWMERYDLDGLRLDAADVVDQEFLRELSAFCKQRKPDFWLMGEVIHGDYRAWAPGAGLDAVTNYELFKGLWSSLNDGNYFEAAWTLNRQFGPEGIYRGQRFYNFGDNHDVNRLASTLDNPAFLYPHAILTATAPGQPSVYYGSEAGEVGTKTPHGDEPLRPARTPGDLDRLSQQPLRDLWARLADVRRREPALRSGAYRQATVAARQFSFWRLPEGPHRPVLVALNSQASTVKFSVDLPQGVPTGAWIDLLNPGDRFEVHQAQLVGTLSPCWGRILVPA